MPDKAMFTRAIENVGADALLFTESNGKLPFKASVQPVISRSAISNISSMGASEHKSYKLFTPYDVVTAQIKEGGRVIWEGGTYIVERIEDMILGGEICFREGYIRKQRADHMEADTNGRA